MAHIGGFELEVATWSSSGDDLQLQQLIAAIRLQLRRPQSGTCIGPSIAYRSEGAIRDELLAQLSRVGTGDFVDAAVFYFSDRGVVNAFKRAIRRGARVRLLLDANKDAFGREKSGIPNRQVAGELMQLAGQYAIEVRWAATQGEQFHCKVLRVRAAQQDTLFLGSANWTRRNIAKFNLEANLLLNNAGPAGETFDAYFDTLWNGPESVDYATFADESRSSTGCTASRNGLGRLPFNVPAASR